MRHGVQLVKILPQLTKEMFPTKPTIDIKNQTNSLEIFGNFEKNCLNIRPNWMFKWLIVILPMPTLYLEDFLLLLYLPFFIVQEKSNLLF